LMVVVGMEEEQHDEWVGESVEVGMGEVAEKYTAVYGQSREMAVVKKRMELMVVGLEKGEEKGWMAEGKAKEEGEHQSVKKCG
jgi:hypothetical protein